MQISTPPNSTSPPAAASAAGPAVALDLSVVKTPANIQQLLRQITISGTVTVMDNQQLALATALGTFTFSYAQTPDTQKQAALQILNNLAQTQKALTVVVQPGNPPAAATLIMPTNNGNTSTQSPAVPSTAAPSNTTPAAAAPLPSGNLIQPGTTVSAIVLPKDIVVPGAITPQPVTPYPQPPQSGIPAFVPQALENTPPPSQILVQAVTATPATTATPIYPAQPAPAQPSQQNTPLPALQPSFVPPTQAQQPVIQQPTISITTATTAPPAAAQPPTPQPVPASAITPVTTESPPAPAVSASPWLPAQPSPETLNALQPGKNVSLQVVAVTPPGAPPIPPANNDQISATVIGTGSNGQLIAKADDATLYVRTNVDAPVGTNLLLAVSTPKATAPAILPPDPLENMASLQEVVATLAQASPALAQQVTDKIPQTGNQIAAPLLLFLHAVKHGNIKEWLGKDVVETLTHMTRQSVLSKFAQDVERATQTAHDSRMGEWKTYPLPLMNLGQMQSATLYVHEDGGQPPQEGDTAPAKKFVRFLIDVRLSNLGPIQLDGLVRPNTLDMIVRSEGTLPPGLPQDLRGGYLRTLEAAGLNGSLGFQIGKHTWITPRRDTSQSLVT